MSSKKRSKKKKRTRTKKTRSTTNPSSNPSSNLSSNLSSDAQDSTAEDPTTTTSSASKVSEASGGEPAESKASGSPKDPDDAKEQDAAIALASPAASVSEDDAPSADEPSSGKKSGDEPTPDKDDGSGDIPVVPFSGSTDPTGGESSYILSSWLFMRALGVIYLIAFLSAWVQIIGLIGEGGILPVKVWIERMIKTGNAEYAWWNPTLLWLNQSDAFLHLLCGGGVVAALLLIVGVAPLLAAILAWVAYLSIVQGGQVFFYYQWDTLLLEVGFLAIFLARWQLWPRLKKAHEPPIVVIWMFWWVLFRLMFFSGFVKLTSGDASWRDLSAMQYHYWTQPIPSWVSWYVHQLPAWLHQGSVLAMLLIELILPFFVLATRTPRMLAAVAMILLQVVIVLTGNFGFFNLLSAALCLLLFDDAMIRQVIPERWSHRVPTSIDAPAPAPWLRWLRWGTLAAILPGLLLYGAYKESQRFQRYARPYGPAKGWYQKINKTVSKPFKSILRGISLRKRSKTFRKWYYRIGALGVANRYGLFAVMTKTRPEIILEGSSDGGKTWKPYVFKWKPGDPKRAPSIIGPHMPRLDWQMWFAALRSKPRPWLKRFVRKLLEGAPEVLALLETNPFPTKPPTHIRGLLFQYTFTSPKLKRHSHAWWERKYVRVFIGPM